MTTKYLVTFFVPGMDTPFGRAKIENSIKSDDKKDAERIFNEKCNDGITIGAYLSYITFDDSGNYTDVGITSEWGLCH